MNKETVECHICYEPIGQGDGVLGNGKWVCGDYCFKLSIEESSKGHTKNLRAQQGLWN